MYLSCRYNLELIGIFFFFALLQESTLRIEKEGKIAVDNLTIQVNDAEDGKSKMKKALLVWLSTSQWLTMCSSWGVHLHKPTHPPPQAARS